MVRRAAFCASIRIAAALVHSTVQFSMRCGVDLGLGVVTSGLAAIAPIPAFGADLGSLIPAASIGALCLGALGSLLDPALRSVPIVGAAFAVFAPDGAPTPALAVPGPISVVAIPVGVEGERDDG
jgi:hypothetical protein